MRKLLVLGMAVIILVLGACEKASTTSQSAQSSSLNKKVTSTSTEQDGVAQVKNEEKKQETAIVLPDRKQQVFVTPFKNQEAVKVWGANGKLVFVTPFKSQSAGFSIYVVKDIFDAKDDEDRVQLTLKESPDNLIVLKKFPKTTSLETIANDALNYSKKYNSNKEPNMIDITNQEDKNLKQISSNFVTVNVFEKNNYYYQSIFIGNKSLNEDSFNFLLTSLNTIENI